MTLLDRLRFPITPIDVVFEHSHGEDMVDVTGSSLVPDNEPMLTFQIRDSDVVFTSISPEELFRHIVYSESIRPTETLCHDLSRITSVHSSLSYVRRFTPICPVHVPFMWIHHYRSWLLQLIFHQDLPVLPIQLRHFDGILSLVTPIEVPSNPINCKSIRTLDSGRVNDLFKRLIQIPIRINFTNFLDSGSKSSDIGPKDAFVFPIKVKSDSICEVFDP